MRKGFSLVELLAVLVILGLLSLISIPLVNSSLKKSREKARVVQINEIVKASKKYAIKNSFVLPQNEGEETTIQFKDLIKNNYIDSTQVVDPVTKKELNGCIKVCYKCSNIEYDYYYKEECEEEE